MELKTARIATLQGAFRPPSDKSLTHRAYMFGAIARTPSFVRMPLRGEDCESTLHCLTQMGLQATLEGDAIRLIPSREWSQPSQPLDCGNSGTTMRLLSGLIASRAIKATLIGDASLSRRPMKRIAEPLKLMGAGFEGDTPPITITGSNALNGITYHSPVASGQIKSCTLLAGLRASGETRVIEPSLSRDHTERMLGALGVEILRGDDGSVGVKGGSSFDGFEMSVPGDISSAAFMMVAAAMLPSSDVTLLEVGLNPSRTGILDVFKQAGIDLAIENERTELGEPVADLNVRSRKEPLRPFEISGDLVPRLIDEIPVLAVLATQCEGETLIRNAEELRVKESDRIELVADGLRRMGATVETFRDGMTIQGPVRLKATTIDASGDHRIAMAFAIAGLVADGETRIQNADSILTSFPAFEESLMRLSVI